MVYADLDGNGSINPATEILEENNYYPFGLKHKGYNEIANSNRSEAAERYKFNGMEWQPELGLDLYDFGARNYDPALGRWINVDPLAEEFEYTTPYNYALNNPVFFIDPDGMQAVDPKKFNTDELTFNNGYYDIKFGEFAGAANHSGFYPNSQFGKGGEHDPPGGGNDRPFGQPNYEQKSTTKPSIDTSFVPFDGPQLVGGYPGQGLDELVAYGFQKLAELITGSDVSPETASNVQLTTDIAIVILTKGKNSNSTTKVVKSIAKQESRNITSRAARREVMRKQGIPTSQQPKSQSKNSSGREYTYKISKAGGGTTYKSVQQQTLDRSHKGQPHWEAGSVKSDNGTIFMNKYGRPKLTNNKSKIDY